MIIGLATNFAQVGFVMSGESMKPSFEKINPFQGFKRLLSRRQAVEGLKALFKLALFSWIVTAAIQSDWEKIMSLQFMPTNLVIATSGQILHSILVRVAVVWLVLAGLDYFFQRKEVDRQLRMTKDELRREMKEQEGSPEIKMAQMQRRRKILRGSMAKKIREADVLITNPTHYAIAIRYERSKDFAPIVLAKGVDYLALRMREIAQDGDVPIVENKPLARSLYAQCEPGDPIPRDLFGPVAEILAYVYKTAKKSKRAA
jgi:flagellar biosynthesis protein FlhB